MTSPSPAIREFDVKIASVCLAVTGIFGVFAAPALSQAPSSAGPPASVSRTTKAVNYRRAGSLTRVDFQGTELMSGANGEARVQSKSNRIEIEAKFLGLDEATKFGLEYLTYVLWAVSPGGRAVNLGEVVLKTGGAQVKAIITDMQTFVMIVTAEPYFAVTQPGNTVVIENAIFGIDRKTPLEVFEARNAVRIAHIALADKYAPSMVAKAEQQLRALEEIYSQRRDKKSVEASAREVVGTAEEARVMAVKQKAEDDAQARVAAEKRAAEERAVKARADADTEGKRRAEADQARVQAEAERVKQEAEKAAQEAGRQKQEAEKAAQEAGRQKQEADQAREAAQAQQQVAQAQAEQAGRDRAAALEQQRVAEAE